MKYKRIFLRLLKHPAILGEICAYLKNDFLSSVGRYNYDYPVLFVAGLAKSGSSWLGNMLAMIPGYNLRSINDPGNVVYNHDICESIFSLLPKNKYSVMKLHTRYTKENFDIIKKYVPRFVVTHRDLRDTCMARYFHIMADPSHRHHELYASLSRGEGISHCIEIIGSDFVPWVKDWTRVASEENGSILLIKYEDLNLNTGDTLNSIFKFYNINQSQKLMKYLVSTKIKKEVNLGVALKKDLPGRLRNTARKGVVGDWKNHFTDEHKEQFKKIGGELLIKLGYEKDNNW